MSRPATHELKFAIRNERGQRSSVWRCFAPKGGGQNDVYLMNMALGHRLKFSMHESGEWRTAFDKAYLQKYANPSEWPDRVVEKWQQPPEIQPGFRLAIRVIVPHVAVSIPVAAIEGPVEWISAPQLGNAIEVDLLLMHPGTRIARGTWPGYSTMGTKLVGSFILDSGTTVWLVSHETKMPERTVTFNRERYFNNRTREDVAGASIRALLFGAEGDGSRVVFEIRMHAGDDT